MMAAEKPSAMAKEWRADSRVSVTLSTVRDGLFERRPTDQPTDQEATDENDSKYI